MVNDLKLMFSEYDALFYSVLALIIPTFNIISKDLSDLLIFLSVVYTIIKIIKELKGFRNGKKDE